MIAVKNQSVKVNNKLYEVFFSTKDAQHISDKYHQKDDAARHLKFTDIEEVVLQNKFIKSAGKERYFFMKKLDGKKFMVVAFLKGRRCIVKSGRICNFDNLINDQSWGK